jgi:hypothetical protein
MRKALAVVTENRSRLDFEAAAVAYIRQNLAVVGKNSATRFAVHAAGTYLVRIAEPDATVRPQTVGWGLGQRNPIGFNVRDATPLLIAREVKRYSVVEDRLILDGAHRYHREANVLWTEFMLDPNNGFYAMVEGQLRLTRRLAAIKVYYCQVLQKDNRKKEAAARLTDQQVNVLKQRHFETGSSYDELLTAMEAAEEVQVDRTEEGNFN